MIDKLAVLDLETTGLNPSKDEIIEVGIVIVGWPGIEIHRTYETKVKPSPIAVCTPGAAAVNGYDPIEWVNAPNLRDIWPTLITFLGGSKTSILAQNVTLDRGFLHEAERLLGPLGVDYHYLDLCSMALQAFPNIPSLSMKNIAPFLGVPEEPLPHRAINGATTAVKILRKLRGVE